MRKKISFLFALLLIIAFVTAACTSSAPVTEEKKEPAGPAVIKLAHVVNEKDGFHIAAVKFKELVEERTKGAVKIEIHPNATLGDERTLIEGMQVGTIQMGVITNGPVANFLPEIAVFEMPFLFGSPEEAYKVLDGEAGKKVLSKLDTVNLKGLAFAERGFRNLTNSKKAVKAADDVAGLKIRVMENPVYIDTFKALGANAVPMAWTEALTALQQKTIDGQENPVNVIYAYKLYETQKYLSMTKHTYAPALFLMSKKFFDSLSKEVQETVQKSAQEAAVYERKWNAEQMSGQLKELAEKGMQIIEPDLASFQKAVKPVYDKYGSKFGTLLDEINKAKK
ncbi:MAG: TRAP transporter substrate-binding protein [Peptococcaceae bacterium]|jgi:tripartite ATP-independent transporter DctP family solute receptor|nr:TRAP transporter substrate-binding protein [Peptococcaceae bacterium]MDH7524994.1 TRAP transporter substrate-binding protein [Peptococcaceae bacterium]